MKKWIALLLALCMCLYFAACGESEEDEPSKGDKMYKKYKDLILCLEDGDYDNAYSLLMQLAGSELGGGNNGENGGNVDYGVYQEIINYLKNENYSGAINAIVRLENEKNQATPTDLMTLLCNTWYGFGYNRDETQEAKSTTFYADGTCIVREETLNWTVNWQDDWSISMNLYSDGNQVGTAGLNAYENGVARLSLYDSVEEEYIGYFYQHPMLSHLQSYSWTLLDNTTEGLYDGFSASIDYVYYNNEDYDFRIVSDLSDQELILHAYDKDPNNTELIVRLYERDGRCVADLTDTATGATGLYYNNYTGGFSTDWSEYRYAIATNYLQSLVNGNNSIYVDGGYIYGNAAWAKVYELYSQCGGYKDAAQILGKFTILESKLSRVWRTYVDNLNQESTGTVDTYYYNSQGHLTCFEANWISRLLTGDNLYRNFFVHYGEDGKITEIHCGWSENDLIYILTPNYNENGIITSIDFKSNSGTWTNYFTCDENGRLVRADYSALGKDKKCYTEFTYDDSGRLIKQAGVDQSGYEFEITYTFDEKGQLVSKVQYSCYKHYGWNDESTVTYTFTCDEVGNPISAVPSGDGFESYASVNQYYTYEDLYFYNP